MAMRDDDKLVRQLSLVAFLMSQGRPVTADEIHESVEGYGGMSEQAFLRRFYADRTEIEAMGLRLTVERPGDDPFHGDLYALAPEDYYLPELDFDEAELSALHTCLHLLDGQFAYAEPLRLALQHLTLGRPSPLDDHAVRTVSVNLLGGDYSPEVAAHLAKIESAISRRKTIRFTYYAIGRDERSLREVDPYSLQYTGGNWYMVGYAHEREDIRLFRLSRIEGRIVFKSRAEHDFPPAHDVDLSRYRDRAPWQLEDGGQIAQMALSATIAWWVEQMFGPFGTSAVAADGSAVYRTRYSNERQLLAWLLALGADARALEPPSLHAAAVAALERVVARHEGEPTPVGVPLAPGEGGESTGQPPREGAGRAAPAPERIVPAERFQRLLALMTQLLAACGELSEARIPADELQTQLSMDRATLEDDLGLLNLINFGGGCYTLYAQLDGDRVAVQKETYGDRFARPARLSPLEAKALLWALDFVGDRLPVGAGGSLSSVRRKLETAIGDAARSTVELGRGRDVDGDVATRISEAIRDERTLRIEYWSNVRASLSARVVEPHFLVNARDAWYVVAHCRAADAQRTFRLDRVRSAQVLDEHFTRRPDIEASGPYLPWGSHPRAGETVAHRALVWCSPRLARWMIEQHRPRERYTDGSVVVEIPYASAEWLVKEVLKHQGDAVLHEPVALRRTIAQAAHDILESWRTAPCASGTTPAPTDPAESGLPAH